MEIYPAKVYRIVMNFGEFDKEVLVNGQDLHDFMCDLITFQKKGIIDHFTIYIFDGSIDVVNEG